MRFPIGRSRINADDVVFRLALLRHFGLVRDVANVRHTREPSNPTMLSSRKPIYEAQCPDPGARVCDHQIDVQTWVMLIYPGASIC